VDGLSRECHFPGRGDMKLQMGMINTDEEEEREQVILNETDI
jgi:hypothetical protein